MAKAVQKRTLETRARLLDAAETIVKDVGFEALRVDDVVRAAGTAKGTFFAHFKDKDTLMERIIGARLHAHLDALEAAPAPHTIPDMVDALMPLCRFMTVERYVFDVILRYSGAAAVADIGPIAETFLRQNKIFATWFAHDTPFRRDVPAELLADGVQAFLIQAMATNFCALHASIPLVDRLVPLLQAWLLPAGGVAQVKPGAGGVAG